MGGGLVIHKSYFWYPGEADRPAGNDPHRPLALFDTMADGRSCPIADVAPNPRTLRKSTRGLLSSRRWGPGQLGFEGVEIQRFGQNLRAPRRSSLASRTSRRDRWRNKSATSGSSSNYQNADAQCFPRGSVGHWRGRRTVNSAYDPSSLSHFVCDALCQFGRDGVAVVEPRDRADPDCNPVGHRDGRRRRSGHDAARRGTGEADRLNRQNTRPYDVRSNRTSHSY
jgi:hypothetical protein